MKATTKFSKRSERFNDPFFMIPKNGRPNDHPIYFSYIF